MSLNKKKDAIIIKDVTHTYKTETGLLPVIKNLTINIPVNGFTAVVGPSGCGKSTLTKLISGLLQPDEGEIFLVVKKLLRQDQLLEWLFKILFC